MKKYWFVLTMQGQDGRMWAAASPFTMQDNLAWQFDPSAGTLTANICDTKKQAEAIAAQWNETFKRNGTYAF